MLWEKVVNHDLINLNYLNVTYATNQHPIFGILRSYFPVNVNVDLAKSGQEKCQLHKSVNKIKLLFMMTESPIDFILPSILRL